MTREQVEWLRTHPQHTIIGRAATGVTYHQQGFVTPDGTFFYLRRRIAIDGDMRVGVKRFTPTGGAAVAREYSER